LTPKKDVLRKRLEPRRTRRARRKTGLVGLRPGRCSLAAVFFEKVGDVVYYVNLCCVWSVQKKKLISESSRKYFKFEIRSTKFETNSNFQNSNIQNDCSVAPLEIPFEVFFFEWEPVGTGTRLRCQARKKHPMNWAQNCRVRESIGRFCRNI
jgi:hypothetical protein